MNIQRFKRGQIWWLKDDINDYTTHLQMGTRPAIIVSNDSANRFSNNVTIIPCTTADKKDLPTHLQLDINEPSTALGECITTVPTSKLSGYIGTCDDKLVNKINEIIQIALGLKIVDKIEIVPKENEISQLEEPNETIEINKHRRGRKPTLSVDDKQRLLNDYETHDVEFMLKKYNISDKKALQQKIYIIRKELGLGVRNK